MTVLTQILFLLLGMFLGWKAKGYTEKFKLKKEEEGFVIPKIYVVAGSVLIAAVVGTGIMLNI